MKVFFVSLAFIVFASFNASACLPNDSLLIYHRETRGFTPVAQYDTKTGLITYRSPSLEKIQFQYSLRYRVDSRKRTSESVCANERCTLLNKLENEHLLVTYILGGIKYSTLITFASVRLDPSIGEDTLREGLKYADWGAFVLMDQERVGMGKCPKINIIN
jgi:hypothetical protein